MCLSPIPFTIPSTIPSTIHQSLMDTRPRWFQHQGPRELIPPYFPRAYYSEMPCSLRSGANPLALTSNQPSTSLDTEVNQQTTNFLENNIPSPSTTSSDELSSHKTSEFSLSEDEDEDESEENTSDNPPERAATHNNISCEFAGTCQMDREQHTHYRKIISHVFGRNKSTTKVFPEYVWVHYCRKHYQRARYRAGQWPFTQCDLLIESLSRMEEWGGVKSFLLILRRREQERRHNTNTDEDISGSTTNSPRPPSGSGSAVKLSPIGRRNPIAVTAPVPDWLLERLGSDLTFNDIREIIRQIRQHMEEVQRSNEEAEEEAAKDAHSAEASKTKKGKARRGSSTSTSKRTHNEVRFPDIEIIPIFEQWALEDHKILREQQKNDKEKDSSSQNSKTKPSTSSKKRSNLTSAAGNSSTPRGKRGSSARTTPSSRQSLDRVNERGGVKKPSTTKASNASTNYQRPPNGKGKGKGPSRKR